MIKRIVYGVLAALAGCMTLLSLWGTIYWHWVSTNPLSAEETKQARYDSHAWLFILCIFTVMTLVFSVLFFLSIKRKGE
jgi:hypothetical protein